MPAMIAKVCHFVEASNKTLRNQHLRINIVTIKLTSSVKDDAPLVIHPVQGACP